MSTLPNGAVPWPPHGGRPAVRPSAAAGQRSMQNGRFRPCAGPNFGVPGGESNSSVFGEGG